MSDKAVKSDNRNFLMDFIKGVAAIGVILVHFQFPGVIGSILCSVGVCGVVFFFLVSGYFAYDQDDEKACKKLLKRFKRNLIITLIAVAFYLVFTIVEQLVMGTFDIWVEQLANPWLYVRMVFMGDFEFMHGDPLWFMPALLYSYLVLYLLHRFKISKFAYIVLPLLILLRIAMETYTNSCGADWHLSGNFLVGGLPMMFLGHYIAYKKDFFKSIPLYMTISFAVFSMALMFVTVNVRFIELDVSQIFKIWCATELLILAVCLPQVKVVPFIGTLGDKYSLYVYLSHYLIGALILDIIYVGFNADMSTALDWIIPLTVIVVSVAASIGIYYIVKAIKSPKKANA